MTVTDLLRSVPGLLLFGLLPGALAARVMVPGWPAWQRVTMAPGLSAGLVGLVGLIMHDTGVPFTWTTVVPIIGVLTILALRCKRRSGSVDHRSPAAQHVMTAVALGAGLANAVVIIISFGGQSVPAGTDPPVHAAVATAVTRTDDAVPTLPSPVSRTVWTRPRVGFEDVSALVSDLGGQDPAHSMLPVALLAALLLPLSVSLLAMEATGSRLISGLAPVFSLGVPLVTYTAGFGTYPYLVDSTLVVPLVIAATRCARGAGIGTYMLLGILVAAVWVVHGLEALTALLLGIPLILLALKDQRGRYRLRRVAWMIAVSSVAAITVTLLTHAPVPARVPSPFQGPTTFTSTADLDAHPNDTVTNLMASALTFLFSSRWLVIPYLVGIWASLRLRTLRWALVLQGVFALIAYDVFKPQYLLPLWTRVFPWSVLERVLLLQYWVLPLTSAAGLAWVIGAAAKDAPAVRSRRPGGVPHRLIWTSTTAATGALILIAVASGLRTQAGGYAFAFRYGSVFTDADLQVMAALKHLLPSRSVVLTDGLDDGSMWLASLTDDLPFFDPDYLHAYPQNAWQVSLAQACERPVLPDGLLIGIDAVYVGSRVRADAKHRWQPPCLGRIPGLHPLVEVRDASGDVAALYAVDR